ncbi:MAG: hypothetical protein Q8Q81_00375 [Oxalobacteraceae bacterium]|nr:hypothetical protein [Oxalobacteraceae bacterium]
MTARNCLRLTILRSFHDEQQLQALRRYLGNYSLTNYTSGLLSKYSRQAGDVTPGGRSDHSEFDRSSPRCGTFL